MTTGVGSRPGEAVTWANVLKKIVTKMRRNTTAAKTPSVQTNKNHNAINGTNYPGLRVPIIRTLDRQFHVFRPLSRLENSD